MTEFDFIKRIITKEYPFSMMILMINEFVGFFLLLISFGSLIPIFNYILNGDSLVAGKIGDLLNFVGVPTWSPMMILIFFVVLMLIKLSIDTFRMYISGYLGVQINKNIKTKMNESLSNMNWNDFRNLDQGKYIQCIISESSLARGAVNDLGAVIAYGIMVSCLSLWLAYTSIVIFSIFGFSALVFLMLNKGLLHKQKYQSSLRIITMADMNTKIYDFNKMFKMLRAENINPVIRDGINEDINELSKIEIKQLLISVLIENYVNAFGLIILTLIFILHFLYGYGEGGELIFNLFIMQKITTSFSSFQNKRQSMIQKIPSYTSCLEILSHCKDGNHRKKEAVKINSKEVKKIKSIKLEKITLKYGSRTVLNDISFEINNNGLYFIQGESGRGKTTIIDIIIGLITPDSGNVYINGVNKEEISPYSWSEKIAYVPQEAYLVSGTLKQYLSSFGIAYINEEKIWSSLKLAHISNLIKTLNEKLNTRISNGGGNFSGGERQRISIARGLAKNAELIILDEPTSSLDGKNETELFETLKELSQDRIIIVVTHSININSYGKVIINMN